MNRINSLTICIVGVMSLLQQTVIGSLLIPNLRKSNMIHRQLQGQQTLNYRANYTADFQHLLHPSCTGVSPVLVVQCTGGTITLLETSDNSIRCENYTSTEDGIESGTALACFNTCTGTACESVYLVRSDVEPIDGVFGSVRFMCESNTVEEVAAIYDFTGESNPSTGSCVADTTTAKTRNLRIAKMGISCPIDDSGSNSREYVYDDTYFECNRENTISWNLAALGSEDIYGCFNGEDCKGISCDITYSPIRLDATIQSFAIPCIENLVPIESFPIPEPESTVLIHTVRFDAIWATNARNTTGASIQQCVTHTTNPTIRIACRNGATAIKFNDSSDDTMECTNVSDNVMECIGAESEIINRATIVRFDCSGLSLPSAIVTFPETTAVCDNNAEQAILENVVSLAVICDNMVYSPDLFFECTDRRSSFFLYGEPETRFYCSESTSIDVGSSTGNTKIMRNVSVVTDTFWLSGSTQVDTCVTTVSRFSPTATPVSLPATTSSPVVAPILSPTAPFPVPILAPIPTAAVPIPLPAAPLPSNSVITSAPVVAPIPSPTLMFPEPTATTPTVEVAPVPVADMISPSSSGTGGDTILIAAVVGGIIGGIAISLLALFVYRKGRSDALGTNSVTDIKHKPFGTTVDPSDRFTDDQTTSAATSSSPSNVQTPAAAAGAPGTTRLVVDPPTADYYQVHYKDQSRSVIGGIPRQYTPVVTPQSFSGKPPVQDIPFATAVPVSVISQLGASDSNIGSEEGGASRSSLRTAAVIRNNPPVTASTTMGASDSNIGTELSASRSSLRTAAVIRNNPPPTTTSLSTSNVDSDITATMGASNSTLRTNDVTDRPPSTAFELEFYDDILPSSTLDNNNNDNIYENKAVVHPPEPFSTTDARSNSYVEEIDDHNAGEDEEEDKKPPAKESTIFEL